MIEIDVTSDTPSYLKVSDIAHEVIDFKSTINDKYSSLNFDLGFCFRALYSIEGINSKVRFYKKDNWLGMDLIMPESEFNPYKKNIVIQRKIMGLYFFPFFSKNITKYKHKLPTLEPIAENLIEDMRLFLIENLWLENEEGKLNLKIIEKINYQKAIKLFGKPEKKVFSQSSESHKQQDLIWRIDEQTTLHANYVLTEKQWTLHNYIIK